jgi:four helix bundle protein
VSQSRLEGFGAYQKSLQLFDHVVNDVNEWLREYKLARLASQQLASADSVCANMEQGFGRGSRKEYRHYLVISRGSVRETAGRYKRFRHWVPQETIEQRIALADEISKILTATINKLGNSK